MKQQVLNNLTVKFENQISTAKTNIDIFLANPQGVAEHIDFSATVEKELEKIAHATDMLEALDHLQ